MWGHKALMSSVCMSVCPVPDPKSRMDDEHSKLKIGKKEAYETGDL